MNFRKFYTTWYHERRKKALKAFISSVPKGEILDVGAGIGIFNKAFRDLGFQKIIAVDSNDTCLRFNDADEKITFDLENNLTLPDNHFTCCVATEIIEHLENRETLLTEIHRVLNKDGFLVLTTPNKNSLIARFDKIIGRFVANGQWVGHDYDHKYVYSFDGISNEIKNAGFKIVDAKTFYPFYGFPMKTSTSLGLCTWILAQKL